MNTSHQGYIFSPFLNYSLVNASLDANSGPDSSAVLKKLKVAQIVILIIAFTGITVNFISIVALKKSKELQNPTTTFVINLGLADLLYCVTNVITYSNLEWNKINFICRWNTMAKYFLGSVSTYVIACITINRFICVVYPKFYRPIYNPKPLAFQIAITWLYSLAVACVPAFEAWGKYGYDAHVGLCSILKVNGKSMAKFIFKTCFWVPATTFMFCYPVIFWITHRSYKRTRSSIRARAPAALNATEGESNTRPVKSSYRIDDKEMKILKVMFAVVLVFLLCYLPIGLVKINETDKKMPVLTLISYFALNVSNVVNPFIYIVMSSEYRKAYFELFHWKKNWLLVWSTSSRT